MIDEEDKARRLAKAICADVMLYHPAAKDAPLDERASLISAPISEGRALYASRVSPQWAGIFEAEVAQLVAAPLGLSPAAIGAAQSPRTLPAATLPTRLAEPVRPESGGGTGLIIAIAVLIIGAIAAFFFFRS